MLTGGTYCFTLDFMPHEFNSPAYWRRSPRTAASSLDRAMHITLSPSPTGARQVLAAVPATGDEWSINGGHPDSIIRDFLVGKRVPVWMIDSVSRWIGPTD